MKVFDVKIVVVGCVNCPYTNEEHWCSIATFETPEEYEELEEENYSEITKTCPSYRNSYEK